MYTSPPAITGTRGLRPSDPMCTLTSAAPGVSAKRLPGLLGFCRSCDCQGGPGSNTPLLRPDPTPPPGQAQGAAGLDPRPVGGVPGGGAPPPPRGRAPQRSASLVRQPGSRCASLLPWQLLTDQAAATQVEADKKSLEEELQKAEAERIVEEAQSGGQDGAPGTEPASMSLPPVQEYSRVV